MNYDERSLGHLDMHCLFCRTDYVVDLIITRDQLPDMVEKIKVLNDALNYVKVESQKTSSEIPLFS